MTSARNVGRSIRLRCRRCKHSPLPWSALAVVNIGLLRFVAVGHGVRGADLASARCGSRAYRRLSWAFGSHRRVGSVLVLSYSMTALNGTRTRRPMHILGNLPWRTSRRTLSR